MDIAAYFMQRWKTAWPGYGPPCFTTKTAAVIKYRLKWFVENVHVISMKDLIDFIFDRWNDGTPARLHWNERFPDWRLFEWRNTFEAFVHECVSATERKS